MRLPANNAKQVISVSDALQIHAEYDAHEMGPRWMVNCRACGWGAFTDDPATSHADHLSDVEKFHSRNAV